MADVNRARLLAPVAPALLASLLATGCTAGARAGARGLLFPPDPSPDAVAREEAAHNPAPATPWVPPEARLVRHLSDAEREELKRAWSLFVAEDPRWEMARDTFLERGGSTPYALAENLVRYFIAASGRNYVRHVKRVAENARVVGEPAVGYFAQLVLLDERPLPKPVTVPGPDGTPRTLTTWKNDDLTRQNAVTVLVAIGPPAVPTLASRPYVGAPSATARRYVAYALGKIATDQAVDAVASLLASPDWRERGAAVKALAFALPLNARARGPLERAKSDPDPFVQKKAVEALAGKVSEDV
jgi:hypothetical protein